MSARTRTTEPGKKRGVGDKGGTVFSGEIKGQGERRSDGECPAVSESASVSAGSIRCTKYTTETTFLRTALSRVMTSQTVTAFLIIIEISL